MAHPPDDPESARIRTELARAGGALRRVDLRLGSTGRRRLAALVEAGAVRLDRGLVWLPGTDWIVLSARRHRAMLTCAAGARVHGLDVPSWLPAPTHWVTARTGPTRTAQARPVRRHTDAGLAPLGPYAPVVEPVAPLLARLACCAERDLLAVAALDSALRQGKVTREELGRLLAHRTHAQRGRRRLEMASERARSPLESAARLEMREAGWSVRDGVVLPRVGEVDFVVEERLVVETDGREFHDDEWHFQLDRRRDRAAAALGLTTLRFTYDDVVRGRVVPEVRAALAGLG